MNYFISDIEDFEIDYPDSSSPEIQKRFTTLEEYHKIAKKVISTFASEFMSKQEVNNMLNSEDAISEIARMLAMADWRFNKEKSKGKTEYSYRNYCGKMAIKDYVDKFKTRANKPRLSLDAILSQSTDDSSINLLGLLEDRSVIEPEKIVTEFARKERVKDYIDFLLKNVNLTPIQEQCIQLKFFEGIKSNTDIGNMLNPKITRQGVQQNISAALFKLKQAVKGTNKE